MSTMLKSHPCYSASIERVFEGERILGSELAGRNDIEKATEEGKTETRRKAEEKDAEG